MSETIRGLRPRPNLSISLLNSSVEVKRRAWRPRKKVNREWKRMAFLEEKRPESRGWTADVLKCVEEIGKKRFSLEEVYSFEGRLQELHPDNRHVKAKIRQQLQVLRDQGLLEFLGGGEYRVL